MRYSKLLFLMLLLGLIASTCERGKKKHSVILISLDTVRVDHLSLYGYFRKTTPFLEKLAQESVVFTNAYTPISVTVPAHASLFTGHYPSEHKLVTNGWRLEDWKKPLLAEVLKQNGYQTSAVLGSRILSRYHRLNPGFDYYQDKNFTHQVPVFTPEGKEAKSKKRLAQEVIDYARQWLEQRKTDQPFFLFIHFYDAHQPYIFPESWTPIFQNDESFKKYLKDNYYLLSESYELVNAYDNSLYYLDQNLEKFFEFLKEKNLLDNTLLIIFSDHGEGLGQHNFYRHNLHIYQEQVRIPLLIRFPKANDAGKKISAQVSLIDIPATIFDFLQIPNPPENSGTSLLPLIKGSQTEIRPCTFLERCWFPKTRSAEEEEEVFTGGKKAGVICGEWKLIWSEQGESELFNLGADPLELKNLKEFEQKKFQELEFTLQQHLKKVNFGVVKIQKVPEKVKKTLKSLGYAE